MHSNSPAVEHCYAEKPKESKELHLNGRKGGKHNADKCSSSVIHVSGLDHDYVCSVNMSTAYVIGSNVAIDRIMSVAKQHKTTFEVIEKQKSHVECDFASMPLYETMKPHNIARLAGILYDNEQFRECFVDLLSNYCQSVMANLRKRKGCMVSCLRQNSQDDMIAFSWEKICTEFLNRLPQLFTIVLNCMAPIDKQLDPAFVKQIIPRISLLYSIISFTNHSELSLVQRIMAMILHERNSDRVVSCFASFVC